MPHDLGEYKSLSNDSFLQRFHKKRKLVLLNYPHVLHTPFIFYMIAVKILISLYVNLRNNLTAEGWLQQKHFTGAFSTLSIFPSLVPLPPLLKKLFIEDTEWPVNK